MSIRTALEPPAGSGLAAIPGDRGPPIVGYTFRYMDEPLRWGRERYERYGPVSWSRAFGITVVALLHPDAAVQVLRNPDKAFSQAGWEYFIGPFFRRGLMLLDFDEHLAHRRIMQQAFTRERLDGYVQAMAPVVARGIDAWDPGDGFLVYPALKELTLDVAADVFMGVDLGTQEDEILDAFIATVRAGTAFVRLPVPGGRWFRGLRGRARLERFFRRGLPAKRAGDGDDLFSALCHARTDDGEAFSDQDVIDHMIFLLMAAHDTATITMTTMFHRLAAHPEWQERCREESLALGDGAGELGDLDALTSLDLVMRECLRLVAPVPVLPRRAVADTEVMGHHVPAGTMVIVPPHFVHHMEEVWPEPERFDPERFADDRQEDRAHRCAWIPFGHGVHKCIGMSFGASEVKATMHQVLRRFRWELQPGYELELDYTALPVPEDGLPVRLHPLGS